MSTPNRPDALPPIKGLEENSLIEWEGKLSAVVFLAGCNFRCPYCHARALVLGADALETIPLEYVDGMVVRDRRWLDAVVVSGGEPTLHANLPDLLRHFRDLGLLTRLYTNGSRPDVLESLLESGLLDAVSMDVKGPLDERYARCAGVRVDLDAVRRSIETLIGGDIEYNFCTTVCPPLLAEEDVVDTARAVRGARELVLNKFTPHNCIDESLLEVAPYNPDVMHRMAAACEKYVQRCVVRGDYSKHTPPRA